MQTSLWLAVNSQLKEHINNAFHSIWFYYFKWHLSYQLRIISQYDPKLLKFETAINCSNFTQEAYNKIWTSLKLKPFLSHSILQTYWIETSGCDTYSLITSPALHACLPLPAACCTVFGFTNKLDYQSRWHWFDTSFGTRALLMFLPNGVIL